MLAIVDEAIAGPAGLDGAAATARREVVRFLAQPGAVQGHWMVDRATGRLLTITIWTSRPDPAGVPGRVASVVGLRPADVDGPHDPVWARVTYVEGLAGAPRSALEAAHQHVVADQERSEGFCGSCWLGDDRTGGGIGLSLWSGPPSLIRGEHASKRRRQALTGRFGGRVTNVAELECLGVAVPHRGDAPL